jgi:hypothetical protein
VEDDIWYDSDLFKAEQNHALKAQVRAKSAETVQLKLIAAPK